MTREELKNKFIGDYLNENYHQDSYEVSAEKEDVARACLSAIEWADKHPKKGLVDIEKVYDYLKNLGYQRYPGAPMERIIDDDELENLINAMEE